MKVSDELSNLVGVETYNEVLADMFYEDSRAEIQK